MFTVALIGPDGAGKTTVGRQLEDRLPYPVKYIYMGVSTDSSNVMLPTTRLVHMLKRAAGGKPDIAGPPDPNRVKKKPKGLLKRTLAEGRAVLRLLNRLSEEWYRQGLTWSYQRRGYIVLFDRHFFSDYYAYDIAEEGKQRDLTQRVHGFILKHFYPKPDLVIYLDAPAAVLYARKGEGSIEALERRRQDYLQLRNLVKHYAVVDAAQPQEQVVQAVVARIWDFYHTQKKTGRDNHHQHEAKSTHHSSH